VPHFGASNHDRAKLTTSASDVDRTAKAQQSDGSQQIDLFDGVMPTETPAWRDLPEETRGTLTDLMRRLVLEHAQSSPALRT
jgi:hypothetical protein